MQQTVTAARVACLGEPLVLVSGDGDAHPAGAELNVAVGLAALGVPAGLIGRLGADEYGSLVRTELRRRGVDDSAVETDPHRRTGHYSKTTGTDETGERTTTSSYARAGSAASAMGPDLLDRTAVSAMLDGAAIVHCSGITAALSDTCRALMCRLLTERPNISGVLSFDVNWREQLWPDADPAVVVDLANRADLVLVGADEAIRVAGTGDPGQLRRILPSPQTLVVKDGARRAVAVDRSGDTTEVPALRVDVVEPVGAGDAFAAGYLSGLVRGEDTLTCLRRGHIGAAATLTVATDWAPPPPEAVLHRLLTCSQADWSATTVTAAGFALPEGM
ncbi:sugar kinase [Mycolicibacterium goodii]|uniref:Carbohydrate kinase n=1 Tax=Mycolicibacterium goodii TaxID=134601 RepID=A0A0K0X9C9_MYCGD|nr:carbohydrate kinase [Mycolicibacterium goodii]